MHVNVRHVVLRRELRLQQICRFVSDCKCVKAPKFVSRNLHAHVTALYHEHLRLEYLSWMFEDDARSMCTPAFCLLFKLLLKFREGKGGFKVPGLSLPLLAPEAAPLWRRLSILA